MEWVGSPDWVEGSAGAGGGLDWAGDATGVGALTERPGIVADSCALTSPELRPSFVTTLRPWLDGGGGDGETASALVPTKA